MADYGVLITKTIVMPEGMTEAEDEWLFYYTITVEWRGVRSETGRGGWAVKHLERELSRAGNWSKYSVPPFQQRQYRWETREEAMEMAYKYVNTLKFQGKTWADRNL